MKKLLSIILSITMLLTMSTAVFAEEITSSTSENVSTFDELTKISTKEIKKISIACSKNNRTEVTISSPLIISNIVNWVKDIQFVEDTSEGSTGGWLYFINFYMEDETYIQYGGRIHIDKSDYNAVDYNAVDYNAAIEKMAYYHDLIKSIDSSEWATDYILESMELGLLEGISEPEYKESVTREEFCELIYNLIKLIGTEIEDANENFSDTDNKSVAALFTMGIVNGKSETEFDPDDYLTREEAATIIIRMINKVSPMAATEMWFEYDDINEISEWASDAVQIISNLGFMNGVGDNRFAPKGTYTTEQAIATLVRVYKSAEASGVIDSDTSIGIIGGADGPTSIIIGEKTEMYLPEQITVTDTTKVDDFYIDEALKLIAEAAELAADKDFISHYTSSEDMLNKILELGNADYSKPTEIYYMSANREQIIDNLKAFSDEESEDIDIEKLLRLNKVDFSILGNLINSSYGVENLAALTVLVNSRGYIMPKDFADDFALYFQYDGEYSALVAFSKFGDGVIKANMSFVKNGDKDNIFSRLYEITQGLGEGSIITAKIE